MKTFKQTHLTKRFLAIILSLIFALSSFTIAGFAPTMDAQAAGTIDRLTNDNLSNALVGQFLSNEKFNESTANNKTYTATNSNINWVPGTTSEFAYADFNGNAFLDYSYGKNESIFKDITDKDKAANSSNNEYYPFTFSFMIKRDSSANQSLFGFSASNSTNVDEQRMLKRFDSSSTANATNFPGANRILAVTTNNYLFLSQYYKKSITPSLYESSNDWNYYTISFTPKKDDVNSNVSGRYNIYKNGEYKDGFSDKNGINQYLLDYFSFNTQSSDYKHFIIGASAYNCDNFNGKIRDFRIYAGSLTTTNGTDQVAKAIMDDQKALAEQSLVAKEEYNFNFGEISNVGVQDNNSSNTYTDSDGDSLNNNWWGTTPTVSNGYLNISNSGTYSVGDINPIINGDNWEFSLKFNKTSNEQTSSVLFGIGNGVAQSTGYCDANIVYIGTGGQVYVNNSHVGTIPNFNIIDSDSSHKQFITFRYCQGVLYITHTNNAGQENKFEYTVTDKTLFESGVKRVFVGTPRAWNNGGWKLPSTASGISYLGSGDKAITNMLLYYINGKKCTDVILPEFPVDPDVPDIADPDISALETAMSAFESKVSDGEFYNNIANAYSKYVQCQKILDSVKYGHNTSLNISTAASELNSAVTAMTKWNGPAYKNDQGFSAAASSDNGYSNAIWVQSTNERCFNGVNKNGWWFNFFCHDAVYVYDGVTIPTIPVMAILQTQATYTKYAIGVYPASDLANGLALQGLWHGIHTNNRSFSEAWNGGIRVNTAYAQNGLNYLYDTSGQSTYNYYIANKINIDGNAIFGNNNTYLAQVSLPSTWKLHDGDTLSKDWEESCTGVNPTIYVLNYKRVRDKAIDKQNKFKTVSNYKEGGLTNAADALNHMPDCAFASCSSASYANTIATNLSNLYNRFGYSGEDKTDSSVYAALRAQLDRCTVIDNSDCHANYTAYMNARAAARQVMYNIVNTGYNDNNQFDGKTITQITNELKTAIDNLDKEGAEREHLYSNFGTLNKDTKQIEYVCKRDNSPTHSHSKLIDASAYYAAVESLALEVKKTNKYTETSISDANQALSDYSFTSEDGSALDNIKIKFTSADIEGTQSTLGILDQYTAALTSALETLKSNIKTINIHVTYEYRNSDKSPVEFDIRAKYGSVITNSDIDNPVVLDSSETVYKWTIQEGSSAKRVNENRTTSPNYTATCNNAQLNCYIDRDAESTSTTKVVNFFDKQDRLSGVQVVTAGTTYRVNGGTIESTSGSPIFDAVKIPWYSIGGFIVNGKLIADGETFTINDDTTIRAKYTNTKKFSIKTSGSEAGSLIINGKNATQRGDAGYQAQYDEIITCIGPDTKNYLYSINGIPIYYGTNFKFRACCDAVITAEEIDQNYSFKLGYATIDNADYDKEMKRASFIIRFAGFGWNSQKKEWSNVSASEAGVILSTKTTDKDIIINTGTKFVAQSTTGIGNQAKISVTRGATTKFDMYAVPYVVVNGETYYGDVAKLSFDGNKDSFVSSLNN